MTWWPSTRRAGLVLGAILLLCLGARLGWMLHLRADDPAETQAPDTISYVQPARALLEDHSFTHGPGDPNPMFLRTPGYPVFVASVFAVSDDNRTAVLTVQVLLSVVTVWLAFVIAATLWGQAAGILAAAFVAFDPTLFQSSGRLLTETLDAFLLLVFVGFAYLVLSRRPPLLLWAALLGLSLAAATFVRPTTYYLPVIVVAALVVGFWRTGARSWIPIVAAFLAPIVVLVGGWQLRNLREVNAFRFSEIDAYNMYTQRAAGTLALEHGTTVYQERDRLLAKLDPVDPNDLGDRYDQMFSDGFEILRSHPTSAARMTISGLGRAAFSPGQGYIARYLGIDNSRMLTLGLAAWLGFMWLVCAIGAIVAVVRERKRRIAHLLALTTAAYVLVVSAGPEADLRFRVPVTPILALFAGYGVLCVARWIKARLMPAAADPRSRPADAPVPVPS